MRKNDSPFKYQLRFKYNVTAATPNKAASERHSLAGQHSAMRQQKPKISSLVVVCLDSESLLGSDLAIISARTSVRVLEFLLNLKVTQELRHRF